MDSRITFALRMRLEPTAAERRFWVLLEPWRVSGWHWRRQAPIGPYVVDFCCKRIGLVVEIDGDSHYGAEGIAHDARRTAFLNGRNYRVLRFTNFDVLDNAEGVFDVLRGVLGEPLYDLEYHSWISQADKYLILIDIADLISRPERSAEIRARIFFAVMYLKESSIEDSRNLSDKPVMLVFTKSDILALPEVDNTKISELNYRTVNSASYDVTLFDKRAKSVLSAFDETRLMLDSNFSQVKIVFHSSYLRTPFFSEVEREIISFIVPGSDL